MNKHIVKHIVYEHIVNEQTYREKYRGGTPNETDGRPAMVVLSTLLPIPGCCQKVDAPRSNTRPLNRYIVRSRRPPHRPRVILKRGAKTLQTAT